MSHSASHSPYPTTTPRKTNKEILTENIVIFISKLPWVTDDRMKPTLFDVPEATMKKNKKKKIWKRDFQLSWVGDHWKCLICFCCKISSLCQKQKFYCLKFKPEITNFVSKFDHNPYATPNAICLVSSGSFYCILGIVEHGQLRMHFR